VADAFEVRYRKVLALVRNPTPDNWYERYDSGLRLERVEQGRRLVAETPVLPEIKFMLDLQNVRSGPAWSDFVAVKSNLVRFAPAWSDPEWNLSAGRTPDASLGDSAGSNLSPNGAGFNSALKAPLDPDSRASSVSGGRARGRSRLERFRLESDLTYRE
jgi:hypothetical protein